MRLPISVSSSPAHRIRELEGEVVQSAPRFGNHDEAAHDGLVLGRLRVKVASIRALGEGARGEEDEVGAPQLQPVALPRRYRRSAPVLDQRLALDASLMGFRG